MSTSGGRSDTDMNAFAVMPCTCSPTRVVSTVTPVANMPSVLRNATAGSPSSPSPSSSASDAGATSYDAPNASGAAIALAIATSNSGGLDPSTTGILTATRERRPAAASAADVRASYAGVISSSRSFATCSSGIVGVSSRQCGVSLSCTIRRKRNRSSEMKRTPKPMILSFVPP